MDKFLIRDIKKIQNLLFRLLDAKGNFNLAKGLTFADCQICYFIYNSDRPVYQKDIEKEFNLRRSSSSLQLTKMENKGLILRVSSSEDKRLKQIVLTSLAKDNISQSFYQVENVEKQIIRDLSEEEKNNLFSTLNKVQNTLFELITQAENAKAENAKAENTKAESAKLESAKTGNKG